VAPEHHGHSEPAPVCPATRGDNSGRRPGHSTATPGEPNAVEIQTNDLTSTNRHDTAAVRVHPDGGGDRLGRFYLVHVYDSLGNPVPVNATFTLEATPNTGPVWPLLPGIAGQRWHAASYARKPARSCSTPTAISSARPGTSSRSTGVERELCHAVNRTLDFSNVERPVDDVSSVIMSNQDGYPSGTLTSFSVGNDGTITGAFSNGTRGTARAGGGWRRFSNDVRLVAEQTTCIRSGQLRPSGGAGAGSTWRR